MYKALESLRAMLAPMLHVEFVMELETTRYAPLVLDFDLDNNICLAFYAAAVEGGPLRHIVGSTMADTSADRKIDTDTSSRGQFHPVLDYVVRCGTALGDK